MEKQNKHVFLQSSPLTLKMPVTIAVNILNLFIYLLFFFLVLIIRL